MALYIKGLKMKNGLFVASVLMLLLTASGCGKSIPAVISAPPPTQTANATAAQSAYTRWVDGTDIGTIYGTGILEYAWVSEIPIPGSIPLPLVIEKAYIKFNLPLIPSGSSIESADLNIWVSTFDASCMTSIIPVTSAWDRTTISATNEPSLSSSDIDSEATAVGWNSFDITSLVRKWINGTAPNYGVRVFPSGTITDGSNRTDLQDYNGTNYPKILINYN